MTRGPGLIMRRLPCVARTALTACTHGTHCRRARWLGCALLLISLASACSSERAPAAREVSASSAAANEASEWVDSVASAHARADAALAQAAPERARAALRVAVEQPVPAEIQPDHRRVVQQDLWYRLSSLATASTPEQALVEAERGLALGRHSDPFCANLLVARGRGPHPCVKAVNHCPLQLAHGPPAWPLPSALCSSCSSIVSAS